MIQQNDWIGSLLDELMRMTMNSRSGNQNLMPGAPVSTNVEDVRTQGGYGPEDVARNQQLGIRDAMGDDLLRRRYDIPQWGLIPK